MRKPKAITQNNNTSTIEDMQIYTDKEIRANHSDIAIKDNQEKSYTLIDVACLSDKNIYVEEMEKQTFQIQRPDNRNYINVGSKI